MCLCRAERDDDDIICLQPFLDFFHGHVLEVDLGGQIHVPTLRRDLPLAHLNHPFFERGSVALPLFYAPDLCHNALSFE